VTEIGSISDENITAELRRFNRRETRKPEQSYRHKQIHTGSVFDDRLTFTFDLLTSGSMHAERPECAVCLPSLVSIAKAVFLLERGHTDRQTHKVTGATDNIPTALQRLGRR